MSFIEKNESFTKEINNLICKYSGFLIPIMPMLHSNRTQSADSQDKSINWFLCEYNTGMIWVIVNYLL